VKFTYFHKIHGEIDQVFIPLELIPASSTSKVSVSKAKLRGAEVKWNTNIHSFCLEKWGNKAINSDH
jgi:hypothetical protein